ncbi:MAG: hypothetical protein ACFFHV_12630 [Promethearchaeota archaeon]
MSKFEMRFTGNFRIYRNCFSWNGCDDQLKKRIEKFNSIKDRRAKLAKKRYST